ncbi:MAG: hypothetical protein V3T56_04490 [Gemmatimonadales bacterium]
MGIIELAILGVLGIGGYVKTRQFVRRKLRFVGAAHTPAAPLVAGGLTTLAAAAVVPFLPIVGVFTALGLGLGVGLGVRHGSQDSKRLPGF